MVTATNLLFLNTEDILFDVFMPRHVIQSKTHNLSELKFYS